MTALEDGGPGAGAMVDVRSVRRTYGSGRTEVVALRDVSLRVGVGEMVALVGRSGSGKTTLLNIIGGLDSPTSGAVAVDGVDMAGLDGAALERVRRDTVSFIFQGFGLIPELSAIENVGLPLRLRRLPAADRDKRAATLLELVGLGEHGDHRPDEMSGGQMQRVAIARALAGSPRLLIADEPTGQLDTETGLAVMALIRGVVEAEGMTAIISTHDPVMVALADRAVRIDDGRLLDA